MVRWYLAPQKIAATDFNQFVLDVTSTSRGERQLRRLHYIVDRVTGSPIGYYDAVFMDIQMPIMDGYEATRKIREFEKQRGTPSKQSKIKTTIIAITAHALKAEKEKCLEADMDDYLCKPLDEQELHRVLLKWIAS